MDHTSKICYGIESWESLEAERKPLVIQLSSQLTLELEESRGRHGDELLKS